MAFDDGPPLYGPPIAPEPELLRVVSARELLSTPYAEPRFRVDHLLPEVGLALVTGDTGAGKSSLLLHTILALLQGLPALGQFGTHADDQPVLYLSGEMQGDVLRRFLAANAAGLGMSPEAMSDQLLFVGDDGLANLRFGDGSDDRQQLVRLIEEHRPFVLVLDTFRALFDADENDAREVRRALDDLRLLAQTYHLCIVVVHHLRKVGPVSNTARERVSGSRDLVAAVDVHLALRSQSGRPVSALALDKTRYPMAGVAAGTEWPVTASWIDGTPPQSIFVAGDPSGSGETTSDREAVEAEILARLSAEGPLTRDALSVQSGSRRRAFDALREAGQVHERGRTGRKTLYGLADRPHLTLLDGGLDGDDE